MTEKVIVSDYYIKRKPRLMKLFDMSLKLVKNSMTNRFGETKFEELAMKMREEFGAIIPKLPYIGGRKNFYTDYLINGALILAIIRILENEGLTFNEIGKLCYNIYEIYYKMMPTSAEQIFQKEYIDQRKKEAQESQLRKYPEDWVLQFVEGDGKTFDYGIDYSECGLCKFFEKMNAERFTRLLCLSDFANARASGYGLKRTQTIANGAPLCDFRYIKSGNTQRGWPPDDLQEYRKE